VDRKALPVPTCEIKQPTGPRTPTEEFLLEIWQQVLGQKDIGVFADFFELGGHSLLATQIVSRIRASLEIDLPIRAIFNSPTVAGLAEEVDTLLLPVTSNDTAEALVKE
jgi:acyl carrier protein